MISNCENQINATSFLRFLLVFLKIRLHKTSIANTSRSERLISKSRNKNQQQYLYA